MKFSVSQSTTICYLHNIGHADKLGIRVPQILFKTKQLKQGRIQGAIGAIAPLPRIIKYNYIYVVMYFYTFRPPPPLQKKTPGSATEHKTWKYFIIICSADLTLNFSHMQLCGAIKNVIITKSSHPSLHGARFSWGFRENYCVAIHYC